MIKKRLFALAMATVMMLSTSVVAFAAGEVETKNVSISTSLAASVEAEGAMADFSISVTVPTTTQFVINPYKLTATVNNEDISQQIYSPTYAVVNTGDVNLQVDVTVKATPTSDVTLASGTVASTSTKKEMFLFLNFKRDLPDEAKAGITAATEFDKDGVATVSGTHDKDTIYYAVDKSQIELNENGDAYVLKQEYADALDDDFNYAVTSKTMTDKTVTPNVTYTLETYTIVPEGTYNKSAAQAAISAKDTTFKNVGTIVTSSAVDADAGRTDTLTFSIAGSTSVNPSTKPWSESDGATVTIKFSFTPVLLD